MLSSVQKRRHQRVEQTAARLWEDFGNGALSGKVDSRGALRVLLVNNGSDPIGWKGWRTIDAVEREHGSHVSRPRVQLVAIEDMFACTRS